MRDLTLNEDLIGNEFLADKEFELLYGDEEEFDEELHSDKKSRGYGCRSSSCQEMEELFEFDAELDEDLLDEVEHENVGTISASDYIKWVQRSLNRLYGTNIPTNGVASTEYYAALRRFNRDYLFRDYGGIDERAQNELIVVNERHEGYVRWVILVLNTVGLGPLPFTDTYTTAVVKAIKAFQHRVGLKVDGYVGAKTELALIRAVGKEPPGKARRKTKPDKPKPHPKPSVPLSKDAIKGFVWALINEYPSDHAWRSKLRAAKITAKFLKAAYRGVAGSAGPIGPGFFVAIYRRFQVENQQKPYFVCGTAMGMAYALMDSASVERRERTTLRSPKGIPLGFRAGFPVGYDRMRKRIAMVQGIPPIKELMNRLDAVSNKQEAMTHIYGALMSVFRLREELHEYPQENQAFQFCRFKYPTIKACCGPNPGCRLDL